MTKKYIITSAYTGQGKEIFGTYVDRTSNNVVIYNETMAVAIIPNVGFMIEIELV